MSIPRSELDQQIIEDENNTPASVAGQTDELQEYQVAAGGSVLSDVADKVGRFLLEECDESMNVVTLTRKTVEGENESIRRSNSITTPLYYLKNGPITVHFNAYGDTSVTVPRHGKVVKYPLLSLLSLLNCNAKVNKLNRLNNPLLTLLTRRVCKA